MSSEESFHYFDTEPKDEELRVIGERLRELYLYTINRVQKACKLLVSISAKNGQVNEREKMCSQHNLLCYLALRENHLADLQLRLAEHGLSSLEMVESHVLFSLEQLLKRLDVKIHDGSRDKNITDLCRINAAKGHSILTIRSNLLFGPSVEGRSTRIMVTLDSTDINQPELIEALLENGMDVARINCAHNSEIEWKLLIETIRIAEERLLQKRNKVGWPKCKILMDLAGPKIRVGPMEQKIKPLKISAPKDIHGRPVRFVEGFLDSEARHTEAMSLDGGSPSFVIAISKTDYGGLGSLKIGQRIIFKDARDERPRTFTVLERISHSRVRIGLEHNAFLDDGTQLECQTDNTDTFSRCSFTVGAIRAQPIEISVEYGNKLYLYRDTRPGHGIDGTRLIPGISCTHPEILGQIKVGHRVFIDDGKIEAVVSSLNEDCLELEIISPKGVTAKIKSKKGINFPDSAIRMPALTADDVKNLDFVVRHADIVGLSFVHGPQDILDLSKALSKRGHPELGIVAKIETAASVHNLAKTLLAGLEIQKFAVLIARGDLAVDVGFENLASIQDDILCLCEAAHIPAILATQILESLAESGLRSRAEIADAIMGQRAECVMLNNGPYVLEAVKTLAGLLNDKGRHQIKKYQLFSRFTEQHGVFEDSLVE